MRSLFLCLMALGIVSCVHYGDIHGNSHPLDADTLSQKQVYPIKSARHTPGWWHQLGDSQLNQLIETALSDSPTMQTAEARVRQAQHVAEEAGAQLWPTVSLSGFIQRIKFSKFGFVPPPFNGKVFTIGQLGLNFNYEFDFWGKNREILKSKISEEQAAEAEYCESQLVLSTSVANVYVQLLNSIAQVKIAKAKVQLNQQLLKIIQDRKNRGINSDIPIQTLIANLDTAQQNLLQMQERELLSRHQLAVLLGKNPFTTDIKIRPNIHFHPHSISLPASLPANLLAQRPDILAAKLRAIAAANQIQSAKAQFFPNVNLNALFDYSSVGLTHFFSAYNQDKGIRGAFDLPIFDAGTRRANLGKKYAEYDLAVDNYNQTILTALREVADHISTLRTVSKRLNSQNESKAAIQRQYQLNLSRYHQGIADYTEVLENKDILLQQEAQQLNLRTLHVQAFVGVIKALGGTDV